MNLTSVHPAEWGLRIYRVEGIRRPLALIESERHAPTIALDSRQLTHLHEYLLAEGLLLRHGATPVFRSRGRNSVAVTDAQVVTELERLFYFGFQPPNIDLTGEHANTFDASDAPEYDYLARGHELFVLRALTGRQDLSPLASYPTPELAAELPWPVVGGVPSPDGEYWSCAAEPPQPPRGGPGEHEPYPNIKGLFTHHDLDPLSHFLLHGYLLACFHRCALEGPVPLLVLDSWEQAMGKTQVAEAVGNILHGARTPTVTPPKRADSEDALSAYFAQDGAYFALLDNLSDVPDWSSNWLASLLTSRVASARVRYDRTNRSFRGRFAALTLVYGAATIAQDLISRTYRVQLLGTQDRWLDGPPAYYANDYALEHRDALVSECYWAVRRACLSTLTSTPNTVPHFSRAAAFDRVAIAAYSEVFGVRADLTAFAAHGAMLSSDALNLLHAHRVPFPTKPLRVPSNDPSRAQPKLNGGTALGYTIQDGVPIC